MLNRREVRPGRVPRGPARGGSCGLVPFAGVRVPAGGGDASCLLVAVAPGHRPCAVHSTDAPTEGVDGPSTPDARPGAGPRPSSGAGRDG